METAVISGHTGDVHVYIYRMLRNQEAKYLKKKLRAIGHWMIKIFAFSYMYSKVKSSQVNLFFCA